MPSILIASHNPRTTTGYGRVVRALAGCLNAAGHEITCLGVGGKSANHVLPYRVLPWKQLSNKQLAENIQACRTDVLLTIGDPWMFQSVPEMPERKSCAWLAYYPIDGYPLPDAWRSWVSAVEVPVVFSKFAQQVVKRATNRAPELIYHGVNTSTFSPKGRDEAKALAQVADHFVVGTVARNQMRKNIPALIKAFARFSRGKSDVLLYLHTQPRGEFDIPEMLRNFGITDKARMTGKIGPDKGVSDHLLATIYRAFDVFVLPTMAEGFGLPIMEAQACGTPVLVTDFSACPELVPDPFQRLKVKDTITMARNFEQAIVDVDDIVEKLEILYQDRKRLKELGEKCHQFAQPFDWRFIYDQFHHLLASPRFQSLLAEKRNRKRTSSTPFSQTAIEPTKRGTNAAPDDVAVLHQAAIEKMNAGAAIEAAGLLQQIVKLRPENSDFHNQLGVALRMGRKTEEAIKCFERSLELRPDRHEVWMNLGRSCLACDDVQKARLACDKALNLAPSSAHAHDLSGTIFAREEKTAEARKAFETALKFQPQLFSTTLNLAKLLVADLQADESPLDETNALQQLNEAVKQLQPYPGGFEGKGIAIVGGGLRYFPCAWICIRMLRERGCTLPIELWHLGPTEMRQEMRALVIKYDVTCIDGRARAKENGYPNHLGGWELKAFALAYSRFREVLSIDADNFPLIDPAQLFDAPAYRTHGAMFWPDHEHLRPREAIWSLTGVAYQDEASFESGQILIDKSRCWEPLLLALWFNHTSKFWYRHILGDKDTFHFAWRKLNRLYAMVPKDAKVLSYTVVQHDCDGRPIFQHRNCAKWVLDGFNPRIEGFQDEDRGFELLEELKTAWHPKMPAFNLIATERLQAAWKVHVAGTEEKALSAKIADPHAWKMIGKVAAHTARCIVDSHAINVIENALAVAPEVAELHAMLGTSMGALGRLGEAIRSLLVAYRLCPLLPGLQDNLRLAVQMETHLD